MYTLAGFDLTTHSSSVFCSDDTNRPRRQGAFISIPLKYPLALIRMVLHMKVRARVHSFKNTIRHKYQWFLYGDQSDSSPHFSATYCNTANTCKTE
jgi:hypothetical protein